MKVSEVLTKYPKLIKICQEAGIRSRTDILSIDVDHPLIKHNLHFIGDKLYESNVIKITVYVKENKLTVKTTDYFKTYNFEWNEEI